LLPAVAFAVLVPVTAFAVGRATRRHVPELVSYLVVGALLGPTGLALIPRDEFEHLRPLIQIGTAVLMYLVGERLSLQGFRAARWIVAAAAASYVATALAVLVATRFAGGGYALAVVLATLAGGGAPMTIASIVASRRAAYPDALVAFHGVCDVFAATAFAAVLPAVVLLSTPGRTVEAAISQSFRLGLAGIGVGIATAALLTHLIGRATGRPRTIAALVVGHVSAAGALCLALGLSVPLCALVLGAVTASRIPAASFTATFTPFARAEPLLYLLFFTLAGAAIRLDTLPHIGIVGIAFIAARTLAKVASGTRTAKVYGFERARALSFGLDSLPLAGVSVALAAVASAALPGRGIATVTLGSVVVFELIGATIVRLNLHRALADVPRSTWQELSAGKKYAPPAVE